MIKLRIDLTPEDYGSLITFIDNLLPMVNTEDEDSRDFALNIFRIREECASVVNVAAGEEMIPPGEKP